MIERDIYNVIDGIILKLRQIIPDKISMITYVPTTDSQEIAVIDNKIIVELLSGKIDYLVGDPLALSRTYTLRISAMFKSLKSQRDAKQWAYNVLESIQLYLAIPHNPVETYLDENSLTFSDVGEIDVNPFPDATTSEAEFLWEIFGNVDLVFGKELNTIYKSLYDQNQGLCDTYTLTTEG